MTNKIMIYFSILLSSLLFSALSIYGQDRKINDDTGTTYQVAPAIARNPYGCTVICWEDPRNGNSDIYAQRFNSKGLLFPENNFRVDDDASNSSQNSVDVAMDHFGRFVIVWNDWRNGNMDIYGQLYQGNGTPIGSNFMINDDETDTIQGVPSVAMDKDGQFVVTWADMRSMTSFEIYARAYDINGIPKGPSFMVNDDTTNIQTFPHIDMHENGMFVITWEDSRNSEYQQIWAQRFNESWTPDGFNFQVSAHSGQDDKCKGPTVVIADNGDFFIDWSYKSADGYSHIFGSLYNQNGAALKGTFQISQNSVIGNNVWPKLDHDPEFGWHVVWTKLVISVGDDDIFGRKFDKNGDPLDNVYQIIDLPDDQFTPRIATDDRGITIITWSDARDGHSDIYGLWQGLSVPLNVSAGSGFEGMVPLRWDPVFGDTEMRNYTIYRSTVSDGPYTPIKTVNPSSRPFPNEMLDWIDTTVTYNTEYFYVIESDDSDSDGYSKEVSAIPSRYSKYWLTSYRGYIKPVIDGFIDPDQWYEATVIDIGDSNATYSVRLYTKYDSTHLYIAVDDSNDIIMNPGDYLGIFFDKDFNQSWDPGGPSQEGLITVNSTGAYFLGIWGAYPNLLGADAPIVAPGIQSGVSISSGHMQYEMAIDLNTSPLNIEPHNSIGFAIWIYDPSHYYPNHYINSGEWPPGFVKWSTLALGELFLGYSVIAAWDNGWPMVNHDCGQDAWENAAWGFSPPFDNHVVFHAPLSEQLSFHYNDYGEPGTLYVTAMDTGNGLNRVYAFDSYTRQPEWTFDIPNSEYMSYCTPALNDSLVFCGAAYGDGLYALDRETGSQRWYKPITCHHPVIFWDRLYMVSDSLYCIDIDNGRTVWNYPISGESIPAVNQYNIYVCCDSQLYCFDRTDGHLRWQVENNGHNSLVMGYYYNFLYTHHEGSIVCRDLWDGSVQWTYPIVDGTINNDFLPNIFASNDSILCFPTVDQTTSTSHLIALDKTDGSVLWKRSFDSSMTFNPSIANNLVYIVVWDYSLDRSEGSQLWGFNLNNGDSLFFDNSSTYFMQPIIANQTLFCPSFEGVQSFTNLEVSVDDKSKTRQPIQFSLSQNYPNPFNSTTKIEFGIREQTHVLLSVYNILGQEVKKLIDRDYMPGRYDIEFETNELTSGIYFYRIKAGEFKASRKMVLLK